MSGMSIRWLEHPEAALFDQASLWTLAAERPNVKSTFFTDKRYKGGIDLDDASENTVLSTLR